MALLPVAEALDRLLAGVGPLPAETVPLGAARGRILAADVTARLTQPPFDAAAMDGYAIRWADRAGPWRGHRRKRRRPWLCRQRRRQARPRASSPARRCPPAPIRLSCRKKSPARMTSPPCPAKARRAPGAHIRKAGQDFAAGDVDRRWPATG